MASLLVVTPRTHWINGWFLRLFAKPVVRVDGVDHAARWSRQLRVDVSEGTHSVGVGARYRGTSAVLGIEESRIKVADGQCVDLEARNGLFNHQPFTVTPTGSENDLTA